MQKAESKYRRPVASRFSQFCFREEISGPLSLGLQKRSLIRQDGRNQGDRINDIAVSRGRKYSWRRAKARSY